MITSLSLQGFKSFAAQTRLEFGPGISAVIGPNGSGKSNVVEAIRWVTHQARSRELRAARASELIFHGSGERGAAGRAALGLAEVRLEWRGAAGERLNLARRVYRDGAGEQDLGGRPARAREVVAALSGSGLGGRGLAVIGQGEVSGVVQAEPGRLLGYLQEAAGLSRSVLARQETAGRLAEARQALGQLASLEAELSGRVERLRRASEEARRHRRLGLRALALQDALQRSRAEAALEELASLRARAVQLGERSAGLAREAREGAAQQEEAREVARAARERCAAQQQQQELFQAAERAHAQTAGYLGHLQAEEAALRAERERLAPALRPPAGCEVLAASPDPGVLQARAAGLREEGERASCEARLLERQLGERRATESRAAESAARREERRGTLTSEVTRLEAELALEEAALSQTRTELAALAGQREATSRRLQELETRHAEALEAGRQRASRRELMLAARGPLARELSRLEAALGSHARYGEGARNALRSGQPGLLGSVADLLTVPAEHEVAVGAALGRRLEQVVVERADDAREIIETLKRLGGRAAFLPLDLLRPRPRRDAALLGEPGVLGNLADLCPSDPQVVGQVLLADTLLVADLAAASRLARRHASRPRLVTPAGELIEPGGALTGGQLRDAPLGLLADQRRQAELKAELAALGEELARLDAPELPAAGGEGLEQDLGRARVASAEALRQERSAQVRLAGQEAGCRSLAAQREGLLSRLAQADGPVTPAPSRDQPHLAELEGRLLALRAEAEHAAAEERRLGLELAAAREHAQALAVHRDALVRAGELDARLDAGREAREAQQAQLEVQLRERGRRAAALDPRAGEELRRAEAELSDLSTRYSGQIGEQNRLQAQLDELRLTLARREGSLPALPEGAQLPGSPREWQDELAKVQAELAALGTVNPAAGEELEVEELRLGELRAGLQDARAAADELEGHLEALEESEQSALRQAHARVSHHYALYAAELLGGQGELSAQHGEGGRITGLSLSVQPRGKRTRSLGLLSTGERTMAGLAFLFALNHAAGEGQEGPTAGGLPLAVLDEVDAPLDEANIRRFTRFLTLFAARGSQFLIVTHQKATMEVADALWGVTTDASGASLVLNIRRPEDAERRSTPLRLLTAERG